MLQLHATGTKINNGTSLPPTVHRHSAPLFAAAVPPPPPPPNVVRIGASDATTSLIPPRFRPVEYVNKARLLAEWSVWLEEAQLFLSFMTEHKHTEALKRMEQLTCHWLRWMKPLMEVMDQVRLSASDLAWITRCKLLACHEPALVRKPYDGQFHDTLIQLRELSCQHTVESRMRYPSREEWHALMGKCATHVCLMQCAWKPPAGSLHPLQYTKDAPWEPSFKKMDQGLVQVDPWNLQAAPEGKLVQTAEQRARTDPLRMLPSTVQEWKLEEMDRGRMWAVEQKAVLQQQTTLAVRVFGTVLQYRRILEMFPCTDAERTLPYENVCRVETLHEFLVSETREGRERDDGFERPFMRLAVDLALPLGARLDNLRYPQLHSAKMDALSLFKMEIGNYAGVTMSAQINADLWVIAADKQHIAHSALLISIFAYMFDHRFQLHKPPFCTNWCELYYVSPTAWFDDDVLERLKCTSRLGGARRPFVAFLERRWYVHDIKHKWLKCAGEYAALAVWMYLLQTEYGCKLENGMDIQSFLVNFMPPPERVVPKNNLHIRPASLSTSGFVQYRRENGFIQAPPLSVPFVSPGLGPGI